MNSNYDEIQPLLLKSEKVEKQSNENFHCKGQLSKCAKGMRKTTLGDPSRGGLPGGLSWGAAPSLPTTHCPPLAHYPLPTHTNTTTYPLLAQPVNISENEDWTVYTLPYPSIHTANSARVETQKVLQYLMFAPQCKLCSPYF